MQVTSPNQTSSSFPSSSGNQIEELDWKFAEDFRLKLSVNENENENEETVAEDDEEFSFVCTYPDGSPISADDIFQNGQIRPVYPLFNRDLLVLYGDLEAKNSSELSHRAPLRKLFVEERDPASSASSFEAEGPEGPYCSWTRKTVEASPGACKKSNSTGFSKLRRFRELVHRSYSDGKDAFVFLHQDHHNHSHSHSPIPSTITIEKTRNEKAAEQKQKPTVKKEKEIKKPSTSAHERLYMRNRAIKEEHKRKSYLPYRVGFFTNVNGLSRNVHPY